MKNQMHAIKSSFIDAIGYDEKDKVLTVAMRNGSEYKYGEVPPTVFQDFKDAESAGQFFSANIKNNYQAPEEKKD